MAQTQNGIELLVKLGIAKGDSKANLNNQIAEIQKQINDVKIDIKIDPQAIKSLNTLANMDLSKLNTSMAELKQDMKSIQDQAKVTAQVTGKEFKATSADIEKAFAHLGENFNKKVKNGIKADVNDLKAAFKGLDASFTFDYKMLKNKEADTATRQIDAVTVSYRNLQGQMEKMKMSKLNISDGDILKSVFVPTLDGKAIDKSMVSMNQLTESTQKHLAKMRSEAKITEKQFAELSAVLANAGKSEKGGDKGIVSNYNRLNQQIQETVQNNKRFNESQRETESAQNRLIANENKRKNLLIDIERAIRTAGKGYDVDGARRLLAQTQALDVSSKKFGQTIAENRTALRRMSAEVATANRDTVGIMSAFQQALTKFPIWMISSTLFYGVIRSAREFGSIIVDIDTKMVGLQKVMSEDTDFAAIFDDAQRSAEAFGQSISSALDSYNEFAKQGFKGDELAGLANSGLVASNVGDITAQKASEYMTASLIQWKRDASESMDIISSWNEISNNYSTTVEKLAQGQAKAGATARAMGLDFDQLNAVIGTVSDCRSKIG